MSVFYRHALLRVPLRDFRLSKSGMSDNHADCHGHGPKQKKASARSCWAPIILRSPEQRTARTGQVARPGSNAGQVAQQECGALGIEASAGQNKKSVLQFPPHGRPAFFFWEESRPWRGLRCRTSGAAGLLCQARQAPSRRTLTVPRALTIRAIYTISHKASH